jgi:hypothetical protein
MSDHSQRSGEQNQQKEGFGGRVRRFLAGEDHLPDEERAQEQERVDRYEADEYPAGQQPGDQYQGARNPGTQNYDADQPYPAQPDQPYPAGGQPQVPVQPPYEGQQYASAQHYGPAAGYGANQYVGQQYAGVQNGGGQAGGVQYSGGPYAGGHYSGEQHAGGRYADGQYADGQYADQGYRDQEPAGQEQGDPGQDQPGDQPYPRAQQYPAPAMPYRQGPDRTGYPAAPGPHEQAYGVPDQAAADPTVRSRSGGTAVAGTQEENQRAPQPATTAGTAQEPAVAEEAGSMETVGSVARVGHEDPQHQEDTTERGYSAQEQRHDEHSLRAPADGDRTGGGEPGADLTDDRTGDDGATPAGHIAGGEEQAGSDVAGSEPTGDRQATVDGTGFSARPDEEHTPVRAEPDVAEQDGAERVSAEQRGQIPAAATEAQRAGLLTDVAGLRSEWQQVQISFVDDPQDAVRQATSLVDRALDEIRSNLSAHHGEADKSTEDLRGEFRRFRDFFNLLLDS